MPRLKHRGYHMKKPSVLSRTQARELDRLTIETYAIPGMVLMENAGRGIVDLLLTQEPQGNIIICCGQGNNGGDGFVVARYLHNLHRPVQVLLFGDPGEITGDAKINYIIIKALGVPIITINSEDIETIQHVLSEADWIIDALFGTGMQGQVKWPFVKVIGAINAAHKKVLSIDIPSGLDCDTGIPLGVAVRATHTVTMVGLKQGFLNPEAQDYLGHVDVVDIGTPRALIETYISAKQHAQAYSPCDVLDRAVGLEKDADAFGFRWETREQIMSQIESECLEIREHLDRNSANFSQQALEEEIGDLLHAAFSFCIYCKYSPKDTMSKALDKFERRLKAVKSIAKRQGIDHLNGYSFEALMRFWDAAKQQVG